MVNVGIIGTGVGVRTLLPGFRRTGDAEVVAIAGSSATRSVEFAERLGIPYAAAGYRELIAYDGLDLVCVASPNRFHLEHALAALESDKHVYLEKPTGMTASEALAIAEAADRRAAITVVGHQLRFNPFFRAIKEQVESGAIGRVYDAAIEQQGSGFADPERAWTWEFEASQGGGVRLAMGSHLLDLAQFLLGGPPTSVAAALDPVHTQRRPVGGPVRTCDVSIFFAALTTIATSSVYVSTTAAAHSPARFDLRLSGEHGDVTFNLGSGATFYRSGSEPESLVSSDARAAYRERQASSIFSTSFTYFADELVRAIADGRNAVPEAATPRSVLDYMRVLDAAPLSFSEGSREILSSWPRRDYF